MPFCLWLHFRSSPMKWEDVFEDVSSHLSANSEAECDEYIRIFEYSNILGTNIYSDIHSGQFCLYEYIRTFVRVKFVCTNIFRHSFMSVLESENRPNIRIYSDIHLCRNSYECHTLIESVYSKRCTLLASYIRYQYINSNGIYSSIVGSVYPMKIILNKLQNMSLKDSNWG